MTRRSVITSVALAVALAVAALVFREPLTAWFAGRSMGGHQGTPVTAQAGPFTLVAALDPDPPQEKGNTLVLDLKDASGAPVADAHLDVSYEMPAMGSMAEMKGGAKISDEKKGHYRAEFDLPMGSGSWTIAVSIRTGEGEGTQRFTMTVGNAGLTTSGGAIAVGMASSAVAAVDHYTCSMHPSVHQSGPGKCPVCGMDLIPVTTAQQEQGVVTIDKARRQLIGVRTAAVVLAPMRSAFRAVGHVTYDESALTDVNLRVRGWITTLQVDRTGQRVARGQTLFTLYSPELYNAQQDFLLATGGATGSASPDGGSRVEGLGRAARQRLRLLGMNDAQIEAIAKSGAATESVAFASPASGFVIEKDVVEGASVEPGARLYRIAALGKVWIEADVYEADLANVRVGQRADVTLDYLPGRSYEAKIAYVYPYVDPKARTGRVRIELANKDLDLRPGMYASVELGADTGTRVQVPSAAVVYTGPRRLVFVDLGEGRFKPQEVQVGGEANGMYEVLAGLQPGDVVATSGVFLIAAEARISTAAKYWESSTEPGDAGVDAVPPAPTSIPMAPPRRSMPPSSPKGAVAPSPSTSSPPAATVYSCPMHPDVRSATPGKCPKCGMDLQPMGGKP
jgi:multidrug efflux pump subunit AcrA (membrane-fusion protein)